MGEEREASVGGLHEYWAAVFESEGRGDFPADRNPYHPGTMAHDRYVKGWREARAADLQRSSKQGERQ